MKHFNSDKAAFGDSRSSLEKTNLSKRPTRTVSVCLWWVGLYTCFGKRDQLDFRCMVLYFCLIRFEFFFFPDLFVGLFWIYWVIGHKVANVWRILIIHYRPTAFLRITNNLIIHFWEIKRWNCILVSIIGVIYLPDGLTILSATYDVIP